MAGSNAVFKTPDGSKSDLPMALDGGRVLGGTLTAPDGESAFGFATPCAFVVRRGRMAGRGPAEFERDVCKQSRISKSTISSDEVRCGDFVLTYVVRKESRANSSTGKVTPPSLPPSPPAPPPRVVGKLSTSGDMPPPPPAVADRATVGLDNNEDAPSTVAMLELRGERDELVKELDSWRSRAQDAEGDSNLKDKEIEDLRAHSSALEEDISGLKAELASVRSQVENNQSSAESELTTAREELQTVRDELDALRQTNIQLRSDLEAAGTGIGQ